MGKTQKKHKDYDHHNGRNIKKRKGEMKDRETDEELRNLKRGKYLTC